MSAYCLLNLAHDAYASALINRGDAFGVFTATLTAGAAAGLVLGGVWADRP